jgi:cytochrome bd-type quinol oxidase subunit 2
MSFRDELDRLRRIWRWSALATIGSFVAPILVVMKFGSGVIDRLEGLNENHFADLFRWVEWLLFTSPYWCLACAVFAIATGATYLVGKRLPDYSDIVSPP